MRTAAKTGIVYTSGALQFLDTLPLESLGPLWYHWKWSSAHVYVRGRKQCCKLYYCLWRVSIKLRLPLSDCNVFFVFKGNLLDFNFWLCNRATKPVILDSHAVRVYAVLEDSFSQGEVYSCLKYFQHFQIRFMLFYFINIWHSMCNYCIINSVYSHLLRC